ncbi:hypothetical protein KC367_g3648 [Hortaea werneckii]|uniref:SET domain-containing protein n=1 Tax=Hortaea werneckii EXF-2000 TaxID=1157616 RepID=A0A1Z5TCA8_HORWE|nr:hypothetical protein KC350_g12564 [Hortaea werneckii]OTA33501.1 hypothetical protein BTJ68_06458 [Hortaea werneckii EXF-2000]KAI6832149.1 hypothetical protein KC358_g6432 [Hortaea werneckii]KAI6931340.1 hypothetical protein KC341_g9666 [Hortaea werneckii]KAI6932694.1 hypothetical protein KC348_g6904 [Hortaea werneckii]
MEGDKAHQGPSATRSSVKKIDDNSVATMSEDVGKMTIQQAQQSQDQSIIREQIAQAVGSESAALLELRHSIDKGYGLFAATDIKRGTCIFKEAPLVLITHGASESAETVFYVSQQVSKLCPNQRRAYRMLHKAIESTKSPVSRIMYDKFAGISSRVDINNAGQRKIDDFATFKTNAFQVRLNKGIGTAVFLAHSRLNHSCSPNGHQSCNEREGLQMLHATRDIIAGEEITVTYTSLVRTWSQRAAELRRWGFACTCNSCQGAGASASKLRRERMFDIDQAIAFDNCPDPMMRATSRPKYTLPTPIAGKLAWVEELAKLCGEEGLVVDQLNAYRECPKRYVELGKLDEALAFAGQVLQLHRVCYGNNYIPNSGAGLWISKLKYLIEKQQKATALAQGQLLYQERLTTDEAAHWVGKKAWAADKKVKKRAKRAIKAAAEKAGLTTEEAETLLAGIDTEKLTVVAEKLKGEGDIEKVKSIIAELSS